MTPMKEVIEALCTSKDHINISKCPTFEGCDSFVILDLLVLEPEIEFETIDTLNCSNQTVSIDATGSIGNSLVCIEILMIYVNK